MKLSKAAILSLRGMSSDQKNKLAIAAAVQPSTVYRWIANNDDSLTKASIMQVIREETGLTDLQLLEEISLADVNK